MLAEVKKCAESNDIKGLHYIFVDCLDVDPTFEKYEDDYKYCKKISGFLEPHVDMTSFLNQERWNKKYWEQLKLDLMKNFSDKRFSHMREVARVIFSDKIERLMHERCQNANTPEARIVSEPKGDEPIQVMSVDSVRVQSDFQLGSTRVPKTVISSPAASGVDEQSKQFLEKKRALELHNQQIEKKQKKQRARIEAAKQAESAKKYNAASGDTPKKSLGVVIAVVAIIVVIVLIKVL